MTRTTFLTAMIVVCGATSPMFLAAQEKGADRDKQEILRLVEAYQAAINNGDAKAVAAMFTPNGDHIGPRGEHIQGRDELEKQFQSFLSANRHLRLTLTVTSLRVVGEGFAVLDADLEAIPAPQTIPAELRSTLVLVKRDGKWLIESARDVLSYVPSNYRHLKDIEWLIGDWTNDAASSEGAFVHSSCDWSANNNFLIRKFSVALKGRAAVSGTEVIGWDPREHRIRAWDFDSNGGFGQSTWTREGDRWVIQREGLLQDGSEVSATHVLRRIDANTSLIESRARLLNGEEQPAIGDVVVKRQLPAKASALPAPQEKKAGSGVLP